MTSSTDLESSVVTPHSIEKEAEDFYNKAWGRTWPCETRTLSRADFPPSESVAEHDPEVIDVYGKVDDFPDDFRHDYVCLTDVHELETIFLPLSGLPTAVVCLNNYEIFIDLMTTKSKSGRGFVVTGNPGIGS